MGKKDNNNKKKGKENVTGKLVLVAIKNLTKNTGWTARTIIKYIKMEYNIADPKLSLNVSRALTRGAKLGLLHAAGNRYRLNEMSGLAAPALSNVSVAAPKKANQPKAIPLRIRSRSASPVKKRK
ncbi:hypothetical protein JYU34_016397 [Plutella xylostella]|uniref:Uncharacterized protein n=2 Tax=Plutella xylostella TaxID=51655 RepID=A0ABQ7Q2H8_PLUXY|nr:uncharacterized protein LOC119690470 [Plutella xylostella]KAG7299440.1 hypothetical protein JYU34_016397 [Plutella xylostella]CAG9127070.1 unnamed protein product [Plutella xylostella]